jgi:steroid delta-isomerase
MMPTIVRAPRSPPGERTKGRTWGSRRLVTFLAIALTVADIQAARADADADKAAIVQRLQRWTAAFNAKDAAGTCDLFAPDLVYAIPEVMRGTQQTMCSNLAALQARSDIKLHYDNPDVHEILVAGDIAVVRLTWTLTTEVNGARDTTTEEGMDVFRRQPDGRWSIARFIAFTTRANKLLR